MFQILYTGTSPILYLPLYEKTKDCVSNTITNSFISTKLHMFCQIWCKSQFMLVCMDDQEVDFGFYGTSNCLYVFKSLLYP